MAPQREFVYIVYNRNEHGDLTVALACSRLESAEAAAQKMQDHGKPGVKVEQITLIDAKIDLKDGEDKATTTSKKGKENSASDHDNAAATQDEDADGDEAPAKPKKRAKKAPSKKQQGNKAARKVIPDGEAGVLDGLTLVFTGTMSVDRKTMEEAAKTYGGKIGNAKKLDEVDWIVLGTKPGANKLEEIEKKGLKTMSEEQFLHMLKGYGEPVEGPAKKKLRM